MTLPRFKYNTVLGTWRGRRGAVAETAARPSTRAKRISVIQPGSHPSGSRYKAGKQTLSLSSLGLSELSKPTGDSRRAEVQKEKGRRRER